MNEWIGAAGVCMNAEGQLLMILQGKPDEEKRWSVPSGGQEQGETLADCCIREVFEETGYRCKVIQELQGKAGAFGPIAYYVTYFEVEIVGGEPTLQDPDGLIHEIAWKTATQLEELPLAFPEDRAFLLRYIAQKES
ncbi:aminoglycoside 6'-N-acetyltransferase [Paenibacillus phyllosphaerae]|uniref:Aminoglycoside 6'-N-acetyltransferase n=1 Tax=Paenibacillus phyllosphaerae TaxID=274593 RepID=A0A7W5B1U2_9BACL|nr:NUDIX domain-containing protein [Paenibacillus phyllosphaerae]MBB3112863.1 aminoglycoside 6'-N-acetyltransferase [Paenibacillus phyllosphaerae]